MTSSPLWALACSLGLLLAACASQPEGSFAESLFTEKFDSGPVASFTAPEGFGIPDKAPYEEPGYMRTMEEGTILELRRADGTELALLSLQAGTPLDEFMARFFPVPDVDLAQPFSADGIPWSYQILEDGFTATATTRGYRVRLFSQAGPPWSEVEIQVAIQGVKWRE